MHGEQNTRLNKLYVQIIFYVLFLDLKKTGSVLPNLNRRRDISQKRKEAKNIVKNLVSKFPKLSLQMMAPESKISKSTIRKVLIEDLKRKPYIIQDYHQLKTASKKTHKKEYFLVP